MTDALAMLDPREARLNEILGAYLEAADGGWAPEHDELVTRYPELASELRAFFAVDAQVAEIASPTPMPHQRLEPLAQADDQPTVAAWPAAARNGTSEPLTAVGAYEALEVIQSGGMGIIYKARQKGANRWVALKMVLPNRRTATEELQRFRDEALAAAHLDHPNIVPIYEVGEHAGQPYFSMRLFERGSLSDHLTTYTSDQRAAAKLLATVARAVHYAHQHGILHRDLKPGNILLDAQGEPHVADFGLAKRLPLAASVVRAAGGAHSPGAAAEPPAPAAEPALDPTDADAMSYLAPEQATQAVDTVTVHADAGLATAIVGTPGYMAPEQASVQKGTLSTAADVYSMGAILYKLLTGQAPFTGPSATQIIRQVRERMPAAPRTLNPRVDRKLEAICMKCLQKDVHQRYASAEALAEDLERWLRGEPPIAWPMPWPMRAWRAIRRYLAVALVATVIATSASAAFFLLYYFDPDREPRTLESDARTRKVTLVGATGHPDWSRWNVGEGTVMVRPEKDKPFAYVTLEEGRLELLRKAPAPRYRFAAEVRHENVFNHGTVGIYFAHTFKQDDEGVKRYWCDLVFADLGDGARNSALQLMLQRHALPRGFTHRMTEVRKPFESAQTAGRVVDWRHLAVEVMPDKVQVYFDHQPLPAYARAELRKLEQSTIIGNEVVIPEFEFAETGGLGLYVHRGKGAFRNVTIEPLP